jgi:hypothetical protein
VDTDLVTLAHEQPAHLTRGQSILNRVLADGFAKAGIDIGFWLFFVLIPAVFTVSVLLQNHSGGALSFDFDGTIWRPLHIALHGGNPYPPANRAAVDIGNPSVYPPISFLLAAPLAVLPYAVAATLWTVASACGVGIALYVTGVRDPRCYGVAFTCFPVASGLAFGNLSLLLLPLLACGWIVRRRIALCGGVIGLAIVLKLFLLPIVVWLIATRRFRTAAASLATAAGLVSASWLVIGLRGAAEYPHLLQVDARVFGVQSKSPIGLMIALGQPRPLATLVGFLAAAGAAACSIWYGRHGDDTSAFAMAVVASFLPSPLVWEHQYALLLIPAALLWRRFSWTWLLFPSTWLIAAFVPRPTPGPCCGPAKVPEGVWRLLHGTPPTWQIAAYLTLLAIFFVAVLTRRPVSRGISVLAAGGFRSATTQAL